VYLPKSKYQIRNTPGNEFVRSDGTSYRGAVIVTYRGEVFAGSSLTTIGEKLFNKGAFEKADDIETPPLFNEYPKPSERDYITGKFTRYFCIDQRDGKIYEVTKSTQDKFKNIRFITRTSVDWNLTGPVEDTKLGDYIYPGTGKKNQQIIDQLEKAVPGFKDFLSPEQFVR
jgi:hypothetical protein